MTEIACDLDKLVDPVRPLPRVALLAVFGAERIGIEAKLERRGATVAVAASPAEMALLMICSDGTLCEGLDQWRTM
jgi:hypothetical protein